MPKKPKKTIKKTPKKILKKKPVQKPKKVAPKKAKTPKKIAAKKPAPKKIVPKKAPRVLGVKKPAPAPKSTPKLKKIEVKKEIESKKIEVKKEPISKKEIPPQPQLPLDKIFDEETSRGAEQQAELARLETGQEPLPIQTIDPNKREISDEMEACYLDYAMSVIVSRALPDVRDGMKPVHRRILYSMHELGIRHTGAFRKSAAVVGEVLGKYHPHGDASVYDALIRMAQDFAMRYPTVHGQGNMGCFTGDTKVKLTDGRSLSFIKLVREAKKGKRNYTYTFNHKTREIEIAEIKNPRLTKKNQKIIKVILDNGEEIKCTSNHRFMLRNKTYKEAKDLRAKDSLMPLYIKVASVKYLQKKENVYDLTIEKTHNFSLDAGVFVHNSIDGDAPAAMRYTEVKLDKLSEEILADIEKETVNWQANYDGRFKEPMVLPSKIPQLLLNGSSGIAVGMATSIAPHNLGEVIDGLMHLSENPDATIDDLMKFVKGPDFPTGGYIYDINAIKAAYNSGRGGIVMRAKANIEEKKGGRFEIIITEIPYQVNKSSLVEKIAELVHEKKIQGISDIRDESNKREGIRIVIELKKDSYPRKILNQLYKLTPLQSTFNMNMIALADGIQPKLFDLKQILETFIEHRKIIITRRTQYELKLAKERAHILEGLVVALDHIDEVIETIKKSETKEDAHAALMKKFKLTDIQASAILEMKLQTLAGLERSKIIAEYKEKLALIEKLDGILKSPKKILDIMKTELAEIKEKFADERKTEIVRTAIDEISVKDTVPNEPMVVMLTQTNYIKRMPPASFRTQKRGGKGVIGITTKEEDEINLVCYGKNHEEIMFFTNAGRVYKLFIYEIPQATRQAKGTPIVNLLNLKDGERVTAMLNCGERLKGEYLIMATVKGTVKKTATKEFENVRRSGLIAIKIRPGDSLEWVREVSQNEEIMIVSREGKSIKFKESDARAMGRATSGVRGIRLKGSDTVIEMDVVHRPKTAELLVIMENGLGKFSHVKNYRLQNRGGTGVKTANVTPKTGKVVGAKIVDETTEGNLLIISKEGQTIKIDIRNIPVQGRATQGVYLMRMNCPDKVASISIIPEDDQKEVVAEEAKKERKAEVKVAAQNRPSAAHAVRRTDRPPRVLGDTGPYKKEISDTKA
ncbi:DNA gyrase subunit A [Candidatus Peregrinibacteria bacterium]|nr:DNA gyrase subunit A [Candidatus Peregrinibacteria bacterium]